MTDDTDLLRKVQMLLASAMAGYRRGDMSAFEHDLQEARAVVDAALGGNPSTPIIAPSDIFWPTDHKVVTQAFGNNPGYYGQFKMRDKVYPPHGGHEGSDIRTGRNGRVYAITSGLVTMVGWHKADHKAGYGWRINIDHEISATVEQWTYAHLDPESTQYVQVGDRVNPGELIGCSGGTGNIPGGEHLHVNRRQLIGGRWLCVDPAAALAGARMVTRVK